MSTLLRPWRLILNMYSSSSFLDEQFRKFHHSSQASMASISISDDWTKVIYVGNLAAFCFGGSRKAFFSLLAVVEELCCEKMRDLVGYCGLSVC